MIWKKRNLLFFLLGGAAVFTVTWLFVVRYLSHYNSAVAWFSRWQLDLLMGEYVRGSVTETNPQVRVELYIPTRWKSIFWMPRYEMAWALFLALIIPLPFMKWKTKLLHLLLGTILFMAVVAAHLYAAYFFVALHGPGGIYPLNDILAEFLQWLLRFNTYIGVFIVPIAYWLCVASLPLPWKKLRANSAR